MDAAQAAVFVMKKVGGYFFTVSRSVPVANGEINAGKSLHGQMV